MNPSSNLKMRTDRYGSRTVKVYEPCNIFGSADIGKDVQIGAFSEIGANVKIGDNVRIGAMCFIPEGVTIENGVWIGPRVTFTNDRFPPSPRENWEQTIIRKGARIGAGVTILCGIEIGEGALVGAGSTVTKSISPGETWCGNPARKLELEKDEPKHTEKEKRRAR